MRAVTKATKTFSLDRDLLARVKGTKGAASESERVNQLLRFALDLEKKAALEQESADFFRSSAGRDRKERRDFQKATMAVLDRE